MLHYPILNPLHFVDDTGQPLGNWAELKHFSDTILRHQIKLGWLQPWNLTDTITLFFYSDQPSAWMDFYNRQGVPVKTFPAVLVNTFNTGSGFLNIFLLTAELTTLTTGAGFYYARLTDGVITATSDPMELRAKHPDSQLITYRHSEPYEDVLFDKTISFSIRLKGFTLFDQPDRDATIYIDQLRDAVPLSTYTFSVYKWVTYSDGIPTWMIMKLNKAFGTDGFAIDGRGFTAVDGGKFEKNREDGYPLDGWSILLLEKESIASLTFGGSGSGGPGVPIITAKDLVSDWWETIPGTHILSGVSSQHGYQISDIYEIKEVDREGIQFNQVTTAPGNREVLLNALANQLVFQDDFLPGETVFILFYKN